MKLKMPALQFYPGDWRKDPGVQALGYFERGVWFEILCLMHESAERGVLLLNGTPMPEEALANILGLDQDRLTECLTKILTFGVARRRDVDNAIYSKRMVGDEDLCQKRRIAGKLGGNPSLVKQKSTKSKKRANLNATPSSSSSLPTSNDVGSALSTKITLADLQNRLPDVPKQLLVDWLIVRKEKRLALTDTALKGAMREIVKAKMTVTDALTFAVERAWGGFKAKWVENELAQAGRGGGRSEPQWWSSPESVKNEGVRLAKAGVEGAEARPGEELVSYKARLSTLREALARKSGDAGAAS